MEIIKTSSDYGSGHFGHYQFFLYPSLRTSKPYSLSAKHREKGAWEFDIRLHPGEYRDINLILKEVTSIEGTLMTLDDMPSHVAVPVEAVAVRSGVPILP